MKRNILFLSVIPFLFLLAFSVNQFQKNDNGLSEYHKLSLYFGTSYEDKVISKEQWENFLDEIVTPNLPEGMTVIDTYGQWLRPDGAIVKEPGKVIIHLYKEEKGKEEKIAAVIKGFKKRFHAQSVIWEDQVVSASF